MSDSNSDENLDDQLLSAYVDGELAGEELARVERRLAADPAAQQFVAELRALSATLRSLPRAAVGDRLREAVLRQTDTQLVPVEQGVSRRWIWASLAVAAALLLSVYLPPADRDEGDLAVVKAGADRDLRVGPRLEAPAETVAESAMIEGESFRVDAPASPPSLRTAAPQPLLADAAESVEENDDDPSLVVHLTLADNDAGGEQFDLLLTNNRIALENVDQGHRRAQIQSKDLVGQADLVLVEAPVEQIAQVLQEASDDMRNYQAIRLDAPNPTAPPVAQWRQWERSVQQDGKSRGSVPTNVGRAQSEREIQLSAEDARARAKRVDTDWYARRNQIVDELDSNAEYRFGSSVDRKLGMKKQLKAAVVDTAGSLRVLFILHPPTQETESAAAPANE